MKKEWFQKFGWIYLPKSWQGYLLTALFLLFNIQVFRVVDATSHSASDTLYGIFPYLLGSIIVLWLAASKTYKKSK